MRSVIVSMRSMTGFALTSVMAVLLSPQASAGTYQNDAYRTTHELRAKDKPYGRSTGLITMTSNGVALGTCSGTLINRRWVLTAGHCVDFGNNGVNFQLGGEGRAYRGVSWHVPRQWRGRFGSIGTDIALVRLDRPVTTGKPVKLYRGGLVDREVTYTGFGTWGNAITGAINNVDGVGRSGQNIVDGFIGGANQRRRTFHTDMDGGLSSSEITSADDYPIALEYTSARGDSGGGVFIGDRLAGVVSFGTSLFSQFGDVAGNTRVQPWIQWIRTVQRKVRNGERFFNGLGTPDNPLTISGSIETTEDLAFNLPSGRRAYYRFGIPGAPAFAQATIPEPTSAMLLGAAGLGLLARRRRRA